MKKLTSQGFKILTASLKKYSDINQLINLIDLSRAIPNSHTANKFVALFNIQIIIKNLLKSYVIR